MKKRKALRKLFAYILTIAMLFGMVQGMGPVGTMNVKAATDNVHYNTNGFCTGYEVQTVSRKSTHSIDKKLNGGNDLDYTRNEWQKCTDSSCSDVNCIGFQPATKTTDKYDINGDNIKDTVYEIANAGQLYWFAKQINSKQLAANTNAILTQDIVINTGNISTWDESTTQNWLEWIPIGLTNQVDGGVAYSGIFDGNNHSISGIFMNQRCIATGAQGGFIGKCDNSTIKNLTIKNSYMYVLGTIGGICSLAHGNSYILNCVNEGTVIGDISGGIVGRYNAKYDESLEISDCINKGNIKIHKNKITDTGRIAGGILGEKTEGGL